MAFQPSDRPGPSSGSSSSSGFHHNSPFGDTTLTKIFVGGLAWETQSETLRQYFEQFGEIFEAVVITDKNTGRSKGYGFVTFQEPESARRACLDPAPIIDGRRANCNLASLGRPPRHSLPFGSLRLPMPYFESYGYQQPLPYGYQQGLTYPSYTYPTFGPEYVYPQGIYNPYAGQQQYAQIYGVPNTQVYPYTQTLTGQQIFQFGGPGYNGIQTSSIQAPYPTGVAGPISVVPAPPQPQFIQGGGSGANAGG
ncbi:hypothetical protein Lser_V15G04762 [Lactuca serriola]